MRTIALVAKRWSIRTAILAAERLTRVLSWQGAAWLGYRLGVAAYYALPKERRRAIAHLGLVFARTHNRNQIRRMARACFGHLGQGVFELLKLPALTPEALEPWVEIEGENHVAEALKTGKGVIYVGGHIGNWELMAAVMAMRGFPIKVIAAPVYDPWLDGQMVRFRARFGIETIRRGSPETNRQILSALRRGQILAMLIDQATQVDGTYVPFLGRPAYTPTAAATLALHTGTPVVMGHSQRLPDGRHRIRIDPPFVLQRTGDPDQDVHRNTARFTQQLERYILERPEQWVWMHRRWRAVTPPRSKAGAHV